jgi:hypothetical protein
MSQPRLTYTFEGIIDDSRLLEMVIGEKVELIQEVANVDATQGIHLRKWQNTRKST